MNVEVAGEVGERHGGHAGALLTVLALKKRHQVRLGALLMKFHMKKKRHKKKERKRDEETKRERDGWEFSAEV